MIWYFIKNKQTNKQTQHNLSAIVFYLYSVTPVGNMIPFFLPSNICQPCGTKQVQHVHACRIQQNEELRLQSEKMLLMSIIVTEQLRKQPSAARESAASNTAS